MPQRPPDMMAPHPSPASGGFTTWTLPNHGDNSSVATNGSDNETRLVLYEMDCTDEALRRLLAPLNHKDLIYSIPGIIWVSLLMVVGIIGNVLVIYVYRRRFKRTSSNYFILTMAIFDLVACVVGMPTEIYDLFNPYTFYSEFGCKLFRSTENFTIYGSVVVLVEIAFDRYFKICRPLMIVSLFKIKMLCVLAVVSAVLMATPSFMLFGLTRINITGTDLKGCDCSVSDLYRQSTFREVYYVSLLMVFVLTLVILTVIYVRIWLELRQRRLMVMGDQLTSTRGKVTALSSDGHPMTPLQEDKSPSENKKFRLRYTSSVSEDEVMSPTSRNNSTTQINLVHPPGTNGSGSALHSPTTTPGGSAFTGNNNKSKSASLSSKRSRLTSLAQYTTRLRVSRTTIVLFAVTVAFVLSFLPAITVMVVRTCVPGFEESKQSLAATRVFSKFNFINNAINPIIYSFLNVNFRRQAQKAVEKLLCFCWWGKRRHRQMPQKADSDRSTKKEFLHA